MEAFLAKGSPVLQPIMQQQKLLLNILVKDDPFPNAQDIPVSEGEDKNLGGKQSARFREKQGPHHELHELLAMNSSKSFSLQIFARHAGAVCCWASHLLDGRETNF